MPKFPRTLALALFAFPLLHAQSPKDLPMHTASGTFDVKVLPTDHAPDPSLQSHSVNKTFHGGLEATTVGEMFSAGDPSTGNAGYVAIERVTGTLDGRAGTFAIIHMGTMLAGSIPQWNVLIAPGSGTGALTGITGTFTITIAAGKHSYVLNYALPQ